MVHPQRSSCQLDENLRLNAHAHSAGVVGWLGSLSRRLLFAELRTGPHPASCLSFLKYIQPMLSQSFLFPTSPPDSPPKAICMHRSLSPAPPLVATICLVLRESPLNNSLVYTSHSLWCLGYRSLALSRNCEV